MMKTIELSLNDFETLYYTLNAYLNTKISADECITKALKYVDDNNLLSKPFVDIPMGDGYRLTHRYYQEHKAFRSIYISPYERKMFYEGVLPLHYLDELKYIDYIMLDKEDIQLLCKKYQLQPIKNIKNVEIIEKPPLGLVPKWVRQEQRCSEIREAIDRYTDASKPIPIEWIEEYNELAKIIVLKQKK